MYNTTIIARVLYTGLSTFSVSLEHFWRYDKHVKSSGTTTFFVIYVGILLFHWTLLKSFL